MRSTTRRAAAAFAALALLAAACGDADEPGTGEDTGADTEETADDADADADAAADLELVADGALTVCSDVPYPPFEEEDPDAPSGYSGFDIDLVQAIADDLGLDLTVVEVGFDGLESGATLAAGQCDLAASAMTITEERAERINFSDPYFDSLQSLIVLADSDITALADVTGSLGVQGNTTGAAYAEENAPDGVQIVEYPSGPDLFTALRAGQIEAGLQDLPVNVLQVQADDGFTLAEEFDTGEQYGFAATLDNDALIDVINERLAALRDEGTYDEIYDAYFAE